LLAAVRFLLPVAALLLSELPPDSVLVLAEDCSLALELTEPLLSMSLLLRRLLSFFLGVSVLSFLARFCLPALLSDLRFLPLSCYGAGSASAMSSFTPFFFFLLAADAGFPRLSPDLLPTETRNNKYYTSTGIFSSSGFSPQRLSC